jgi:hypothetical protein
MLTRRHRGHSPSSRSEQRGVSGNDDDVDADRDSEDEVGVTTGMGGVSNRDRSSDRQRISKMRASKV